MPGFVLREKRLVVSFFRDGNCIDAVRVASGSEATDVALRMIEAFGWLRNHDQLVVSEDPIPDDNLPEFSRASHSS